MASVSYKAFAYPLHLCVWNDDLASLSELLEQGEPPDTQDAAQNTPIMLALKMKNLAAVRILMRYQAQTNIKDGNSWGLMAVARSVLKYPDPANEAFLRELLAYRHSQLLKTYYSRIPSLRAVLVDVPDFYMEIDYAFSSWIPLVGRVLPTETLKIWKLGEKLRIDLTLVGFEGLRWQRGQLSFLFDAGDLADPGKFTVVDHEKKTWDDALNLLKTGGSGPLFDEAIDKLLVHKVVAQNLWSRDTEFAPATTGLMHKTEAIEKVCSWNTRVMNMSNLKLTVLTRPRPLADRKPLQEFIAKQMKAVTGSPETKHQSEERGEVESPSETESEKDDLGWADTKARLQAINMVAAAAEYSMGDQSKTDAIPAADFVEATVAAGKHLHLSFPLRAFDKLTWLFAVLYYDIQFSVEFVDSATSASLIVHEPAKVSTPNKPYHGSFTAPTEGTVIARFDNSYSRLRGKTLKYRLFTSSPSVDGSLAKVTAVNEASGSLVSLSEYFKIAPPAECKVKGTVLMPPLPCKGETKTTNKVFSSKIWMANDFPLTRAHISAVAEVLARTTTHYENFNAFLESRLPPGVPVRFEIPLLPMVAACITFSKCTLCTPEASLFEVPKSYEKKEPKSAPTTSTCSSSSSSSASSCTIHTSSASTPRTNK